jgi:hypothetical protein
MGTIASFQILSISTPRRLTTESVVFYCNVHPSRLLHSPAVLSSERETSWYPLCRKLSRTQNTRGADKSLAL